MQYCTSNFVIKFTLQQRMTASDSLTHSLTHTHTNTNAHTLSVIDGINLQVPESLEASGWRHTLKNRVQY